jgi:hypothetical protein
VISHPFAKRRKDGARGICGTFEGRFYFCAFDEALRQAEAGAEPALAAGHLAGVGFVVVTGEMEQAVKDEDFDFGRERMTLLAGLAQRGGDADGQVTGDLFSADAFGGKGEHVGGFVLVAELAIEFANRRVGGEQHCDLAFEANGGLRFGEKTCQGAGGGQA